MIEPTEHRETTCLFSAEKPTAAVSSRTQHELLEEKVCDRFSQWLEHDLEKLEARFDSFISSRTLMSSLRS